MTPLFRIAIASFLVLGLTPCVSGQENRTLSKGTYRIQGKCLEMTWLGDEKTSCQAYMGIIVSDPERPEFVFARTDGGAWIFNTSDQVQSENNPEESRYRVASTADLSMKMQWKYDGECVIHKTSQRTVIACTAWRDPEHKNVARRVEFAGNGNWLFSKSD